MSDDLVRLMAAVDGEDPSPEFVSALRHEIDAELVDDHDGAVITIRFTDRSVQAADESGDDVSAGDRLPFDEVTAPIQRRRSPDESVTRGSFAASIDTANGSPGAEVREQPDDHLGVDYLLQLGEVTTRADRRRWTGLAAVAATAVLVAVGVVVATRESSDDPVSAPPVTNSLPYRWSRVPHDETAFRGARGQWMSSVTVGGPGLVAVGSVGNDGDADAAVWTSVDGITWSRVAHDETVFGGARGQWMNSVTAGGPGLVAVGSDGRFSEGYRATGWYEWGEQNGAAAVWTSVDGITWSRVAHDEAVFGAAADQEMNSVTVGGPGLVAVGSVGYPDDAAVWTSVDGITWSRVAHDEAVFGGALGHSAGMNSVTVGGPGLVAVGEHAGDAVVWTSVDGITWSRVEHDEAVFSTRSECGHCLSTVRMSSVVAAGAGLVAVGSDAPGGDEPPGTALDAAVWTSVDGLTWSRVAHDVTVFGGTGNQRMHSVTATAAGLVAVGGDGGFYYTRPDAAVWTSVDGMTWSRVAHDEAIFGGAEMHSVTVTGADLVAVGDESLETKDRASRQAAIEAGDSVFVWLAEPEP